MPILCTELLCTQERQNPEVAIILGAAASYRRVATAHWGGSPRPKTGFVASLFLISPRTGHGKSQVFEILPAASFFVYFVGVRFM
jgi:hypothetical protein